MRAAWFAWAGAMLAAALLLMLPLRLALAGSDLERIGFTARQVAGTIWYGRIGELQLRSQPIGTLEVSLDPAPLLIGNVSMHFSRLDNPDGPLEGRLVAGLNRGIVGTSGRVAVGDMFSPLPIAVLELEKVTVLFRNGRCIEAAGRITPVLAAPVPGVDFGSAVSGAVECDGERARVEVESPSGAERIDFYVQESGDYRGWMSVRNASPDVNAALTIFGFRPSSQGMTLSIDGRL